MGRYIILGIILAFVFTINFSSATSITQVNNIYNLGDELNFEVQLDSIEEGYLDVNLICDNFQNIHHSVPQTNIVAIKISLTREYIRDLIGNCRIEATYNEQTIQSSSFFISNEINIQLEKEDFFVKAGDMINIKGTSIKENYDKPGNIPAFAEVIFNELKNSAVVKNGDFSINFSIPENTPARDYGFTVKVYEKDNEVLNIGEKNIRVKVEQMPFKLELALDKPEVLPEQTIKIMPLLYDKAREQMNSKINLKIIDSKAELIFDEDISSNIEYNYKFSSNHTAGDTIIIAKSGDIETKKSVKIGLYEKIDVEFKNSSLIVINVGNMPYSGKIETWVNNFNITKYIEIGIAEKKIFDLFAPNGNYKLEIKDDTGIIAEKEGVVLTGKAISMHETSDKVSSLLARYPIVWVFLAIIIIAFFFSLYRRRFKKRFYGFPFEKKQSVENLQKVKVPATVIKKEEVEIAVVKDIRRAEQVLVMHGKKQATAILSLKIKNNISENSKENVMKALEYGYQLKGASYTSGNNILLIFSPLLTKKTNNEEIAIKAGLEIANFLNNCNKKFKDKINFGIGINTGEVVTSLEDNVLKFASIDKTVGTSKKISDISDNEVLLSKEAHIKTMNNIKAEKNQASANIETFRIKRVVDTEKSQKFIKDFLKRN